MRFFRGHHGLLRSMVLVVACGSLALFMASARLYASINTTGGDPAPRVQAKEITLLAGDIFEMTTVNDYRAPLFSWVLTKDRMFLSSSHDPIFRSRFIEPGLYRIDANVQDASGSDEQRTVLFVNVTKRPFVPGEGSGSVESPSTQAQDPLTTDPPLSGNTLTVSTGSTIVKITPSFPAISAYTLTIDLPGAPLVNITNGTYSQTQGTPLYAWFLSSTGTFPMHLIATTADGTNLQREYVAVIGSDEPTTSPASTMNILGRVGENGSVIFALNGFDENGAPLLYRWSFGDGTASLGSTPSHLFSSSGTYLVAVTVTDLRTLQPVASAQGNFAIQAVHTPTKPVQTSSSSASSRSARSSKTGTASSASAGGASTAFSLTPLLHILLWVIVILLGIVVASVIAWLIVKLINREGMLQDQLEKAEQRIAGGTGAGMTPEPPPLEIKRTSALRIEPEASTDTEIVTDTPSVITQEPATESVTQTPPSAETIDVDNAPSWLRHGLEMAKTTEPVASETTAPPTAGTDQVSTPVPDVTAVPTETETIDVLPQPTEPLPDWLKSGSTPPEPPPVNEPVAAATVQSPTTFATDAAQVPPSLEPPTVVETNTPPPTPPVPTYEPEVVAAPQPSLPEPPRNDAPTPSMVATPTTPASVASSPQSDAEREREERERERKRRKRQRYRDNLKKRKLEEKSATPAPSTAPVSAPATAQAQVVPAPLETPDTDELPTWLKQPAPVTETKPDSPATTKDVEPLPAPVTSASIELSTTKPDAKELPPKDDQVVFVVEAPDLSKKKNAEPTSS